MDNIVYVCTPLKSLFEINTPNHIMCLKGRFDILKD